MRFLTSLAVHNLPHPVGQYSALALQHGGEGELSESDYKGDEGNSGTAAGNLELPC